MSHTTLNHQLPKSRTQLWLKPGPESNVLAQLSATISQVQGNNFNSDVCPSIIRASSPLFLSFSIYCLALAFEHYRQVYIVHSGLQDESLQVTISKLPYGSLTCTGGDFPCTGDIQLTSRSEGRCTYLASSLQMTLEKACLDTEIFLAASRNRTWDL